MIVEKSKKVGIFTWKVFVVKATFIYNRKDGGWLIKLHGTIKLILSSVYRLNINSV